jgi:heavy metal sensor kinase
VNAGGPRRTRSLRTRLTLWYGGLLALCLGASTLATVAFFRAHVRAELDRRVHEDIELAARAIVHDRAGGLAWAGGFLGKKLDEEPGGGHWVEVWDERGRLLLASGTRPALDLGPAPNGDGAGQRAHSLATPVGPVRSMSERVEVAGQPVLVRAAVSEAGVRAQARALWIGLAGVALAVLTLGGLGGYVLARRALGPLARMAERAGRLNAEQLHERLPPDRSSRELDQLRAAFNATLARLERSFEQLRRFIADASHELRTPLTTLRTVGEVGLQRARDVDDYREVVGSMLEEVARLSRLTDELLTLSRAESGQAQLRPEPVDLGLLAREVVDDLGVLAEERGQTLLLEASDGRAIVQADRLWLRQALLNLVDNAIKYTPPEGHITVAVSADASSASVSVRDDGPGIATAHHERVFERFYRVERSRSRAIGGTGLGLALAKWAAEAHGGRIELQSQEGHGSTFRLVLPCPVSPTRLR